MSVLSLDESRPRFQSQFNGTLATANAVDAALLEDLGPLHVAAAWRQESAEIAGSKKRALHERVIKIISAVIISFVVIILLYSSFV